MAIVITTNDGATQKEEIFSNKDDVFKSAVQPEAKTAPEPEKTPEESATKGKENNSEESNEDKSLDYLNESETESEESDDDLGEDDDTDTEEDSKPKKSGLKKRFDKLTKEKTELRNEIEALKALVLKGANPPANNTENNPKVPVEELKEPNIDDFDDYPSYIKAFAKYNFQMEKQAMAHQTNEEKVKQEAEAITQKWQERVAEARNRYGAEKWDSFKNTDLPLSVQMRADLMQSEVGPDILFFLVNNPNEAKRINGLTPAQQIKELTKIELKIIDKIPKKDDKNKPKVSNAPEPVKPIKNSSADGKGSKDPSQMSFKEYKVWREKNK